MEAACAVSRTSLPPCAWRTPACCVDRVLGRASVSTPRTWWRGTSKARWGAARHPDLERGARGGDRQAEEERAFLPREHEGALPEFHGRRVFLSAAVEPASARGLEVPRWDIEVPTGVADRVQLGPFHLARPPAPAASRRCTTGLTRAAGGSRCAPTHRALYHRPHRVQRLGTQ